MSTKIITTVGASLFENYAKEKNDSTFKRALEALKENAYPYDKWEDRFVNKNLKKLEVLNTWSNGNTNASAEIKSILKIKEAIKGDIEVHLIATDTVLSVKAAELIKEWLGSKNINANFEFPTCPLQNQNESNFIVKDLRISNSIQYQNGFFNLIKVLDKIANDHSILNITGGYKAIIPILTIYGQINKLPLKYIYDDSQINEETRVVTINNLPIEFDWTLFEDNYLAFEQLKKEGVNLPDEHEFKSLIGDDTDLKRIKEYSLTQKRAEGKIAFSYIGKLIFNKYEELYNKEHFKRQNLLANLVELKIFQYFSKQKKENLEIGKKVGDRNYDIDIYFKENNVLHFIEVKPGGNIPIQKKKSNNTIWYRLNEGSFRWVVENLKADKYIFDLWLYSHKDIHETPLKQLKELYDSQSFGDKKVELRVTHLKLNPNYKKDFTWIVDNNNVNPIFSKKIIIKFNNYV